MRCYFISILTTIPLQVRLKTQLQKDALQKKLEDLDIQKRDLLEAVISTRKSLELIQYALPTGEQSKS